MRALLSRTSVRYPNPSRLRGRIGAMSDIRRKLKMLHGMPGVMTGSQWQARSEQQEEQRASGDFEVDWIVPGEIIGDDEDGFYRVRNVFPLDTQHGAGTLGELLQSEAQHIAFSASDDDLAGFNPETTVFVDTETTGLSGGTGTVSFLVGAGYFENDAFVLDQCFMRDFHEEEPMLHYLREIFARCDTLVSYNGKSFDLPLLRTRFISNRVPFHLDAAEHLDLVHAARRFWRKRLRDCSLGNIEREVLGIRRVGDVPSAEIPERWLKYLRERDARPLEPVFYHHRMDILSLVTLTSHLASAVAAPDAAGFGHAEDKISLLRQFHRRADHEEVLRLAESLLSELSEDALRRECLELAGLSAKRCERWTDAEHFFRTWADEDPGATEARLELAKIYEHRMRDLPSAEAVCLEALNYEKSRSQSMVFGSHVPAIEHRLTRIRRKFKGSSFNEL